MEKYKQKTIYNAIESALRWHSGDKWRFSDNPIKREVWQYQKRKLIDALKLVQSDTDLLT